MSEREIVAGSEREIVAGSEREIVAGSEREIVAGSEREIVAGDGPLPGARLSEVCNSCCSLVAPEPGKGPCVLTWPSPSTDAVEGLAGEGSPERAEPRVQG